MTARPRPGALAASWHSNKFLDPRTDGAVLPVLHLNGFKIANPTILARIPDDELTKLFEGYGYHPYLVAGDDPGAVHAQLAETLDTVVTEIREIQQRARAGDGAVHRPTWPMVILRTPKGWTGPAEVDGKQVEGTFRAHQVPLDGTRTNDEHRAQLESLDAVLPPRGALRRARPAGAGAAGTRSRRASGG